MVPVPQAIRKVLTETALLIQQWGIQSENVSLSQENLDLLVGRISAETIRAPDPGYPPYNASIMDGYAINLNDFSRMLSNQDYCSVGDMDQQQFHVLDRVYAGPAKDEPAHDFDVDIADYTKTLPKAIYVTTGAVVPMRYNAVVPLEQVDESHLELNVITIHHSVLRSAAHNLWIRPIGCDIRPSTIILQKGEKIEPVHIGLLIQCGVHSIQVNRLTKVAILSTGNELYPHHQAVSDGLIGTGMIPDVNGPVLCSLLRSYENCEPFHLGIAKDDDEERLTTNLRKCLMNHDIVLTTGGISVGEMDVMERVLVNNIGCTVHFGRLDMKPGKPTTFLTSPATEAHPVRFVFAMPGNPVSAMVCTELLVRPCLDMLCSGCQSNHDDIHEMVQSATIHPEIMARLENDVSLDTSRPEYHRVTLEYQTNVEYDDGSSKGVTMFYAKSTGVQRSSRLQSMSRADGLMILPQGVKGSKVTAKCGEVFPVLLLKKWGGRATNIHSSFQGVLVKNSIHLGKRRRPTVGLLQVSSCVTRCIEEDGSSLDSLNDRIQQAWRPICNDGIVLLESKHCKVDNIQETLLLKMKHALLDILIVVGTDLSFLEYINVSECLKTKVLWKCSEHLSLLLRHAAANDAPLMALFEPVMGWMKDVPHSCMVICIPEDGLEASLACLESFISNDVLASTLRYS